MIITTNINTTNYPALRTYQHQITILNLKIYSDGTVVQFPNLSLLPGTKRHDQLGIFNVPSLPQHGHGLFTFF